MLIYIDKEYKCHASNDGTMREFDLAFFDGKCVEFIEGYKYIPPNETGTEIDGMLAPWKDDSKLEIAQLRYELADADAGMREVGIEW